MLNGKSLEKVRKPIRLISIGLKRRYLNLIKTVVKHGMDIDRYLKKNYREIKEIKVDKIAKKSSIHQRKDEVVFTIRITPDKDSTTGYIVDEGVICEDSNC